MIIPDNFQSLLPSNKTKLEADLEKALLLRQFLTTASSDLKGIKLNPPDDLLPWLVWEYGLSGVVPYLPNLRVAIQEGLLWQKERGTEAAVRRALGWIDIDPPIFEHETPGVHWNEYQMDVGKVPNAEELEAIIKLSEMSSPARSKLRRLYHNCDRRRFIFSESQWGDLFGDYSGVRPDGLGGYLALAFCHHENTFGIIDPLTPVNHVLFNMGSHIKFWGGPLFSRDMIFGESAHPNYPALIKLKWGHNLKYIQNYWVLNTWQPVAWEEARFVNKHSVRFVISALGISPERSADDFTTLKYGLSLPPILPVENEIPKSFIYKVAHVIEYKQDYWNSNQWPVEVWKDMRLGNKASVNLFCKGSNIETEPEFETGFNLRDGVVVTRVDTGADVKLSWVDGVESQPYKPAWRENYWGENPWNSNIDVRSGD